MHPARCLIVDDESPARDELRYLLQNYEDIEVVGEAATVSEARVLLDAVHYDVILLDIRMPGDDGLALAEHLRGIEASPAVIFTTAYPDYAVDAFGLNAVDYVLKPVDADRLRQALDRVLSQSRRASDNARPQPEGLTEQFGRIPVQRGERILLVDEQEILYASAARGYSYLHVGDKKLLANFTLSELEDRLSSHFFRCHRSYLVNLDKVRELVSDFAGAMVLVMGDGGTNRVPVSRRRIRELRQMLGM